MNPTILAKRVHANLLCRFDEFWTFKVDILISILNTILEVAMWYFMAQIINPASLGYEGVGYLPFILVGSVAIFFVDSVYSNFTEMFGAHRDNGMFKLAYLSNMGVIEYFLVNFLVSIVFDIFTVFVPMIIMFLILVSVTGATSIFHLGVWNVTTLMISLLIFIVGNLGFQLMTVGSTLFLKEGDPVSFFMEQFNRLFSGQLFPISFLPAFLAFLPKILPAAYIILIWRETLFKNEVLFSGATLSLILVGFIVNIVVFFIGLYVFYYGVRRAKREGRWF
jgi:ABC-type polysaccharide/polyol phosphate export permease